MITLVAITLVALGLLVPFWGFVAIAIAIAVVRGAPVLALSVALGADILYGPPVGVLHQLSIPFVLCTLLALGVRYFLTRDMREDVPLTL